MLSPEVVRQLGDGTGADYQFDFSKIPAEFYEPILRTLQHFAQKQIQSIGFNCDSMAKAEQMTLVSSSSVASTNKKLPVIIANSIAKNKSHYISNIIELLCYVLPRSTRIKELTLSNMNIRRDYMQKLITALSKSKSLETINLVKIPIGNELMHLMMTTLDPNIIKSIKINYCGITSSSTSDIIQFIQKKQINNLNGIQYFEITKTEIPEEDQILIQNALQQSSQQNNYINFNIPSPNINSGSPKSQTLKNDNNLNSGSQRLSPISVLSPINSNYASSQKFLKEKKNNEIAQIKAYENENAQLRKELAELRSSLNAVKYNDNVFIVGKGAEEFVNYISDIEAKIKNFEDQKSKNGSFF
ncbi:hypothetical protein M9Y10_004237 [Tritrichomonas musculus]|uniref:Kinesin motor domain-containing protein n=1 Tax=Tritrichomonas musculus TaxID=1915356 RepID=A0ABR2JRI9_9EUKA